jgi:hypothetical protein
MRKTHNTRQQHNKTLRKGKKHNKQKITKYIRRSRILKKKTSQNGLDDFRRSNNKTKKMKLQYNFFTKVIPRGSTLDDLGGGGGTDSDIEDTEPVSNIEDTQIDKEKIFKEFIMFAYALFQTPEWYERIIELCGGETGAGMFSDGNFPDCRTLDEFEFTEGEQHLGEELKKEIRINVIFRMTLSRGLFRCWFFKTHPTLMWMWGDGNSHQLLDDKFFNFVAELSYPDLMEIIGNAPIVPKIDLK